MGGIVSGVWVLLLAFANSAVAQTDDLELTPPSDLAPASPNSASPDGRGDSGLGLRLTPDPEPPTRPRPASVVTQPRTVSPATGSASGGDLPVLFGPAEMPEPAPSRRGVDVSPRTRGPVVRESAPRLTLETEALPPSETRPKPPVAPSAGWRSRWFGRGGDAPSTMPLANPTARPPLTSTAEGSLAAATDPAADSALKRRVEREIRQAVGSHLRSLEVLVVDRRVIVQASALRFWQRRALRRSIETLPSLAGTRASVHVDD